MSPDTWEDWRSVANERMMDARSLLLARANSVAPVYLAGYAIECSLKALLQRRGTGFPTYGSEGHNLRSLWASVGFTLGDISGAGGSGTYYIESWSTDLRYQVTENFPSTCEELLTGAAHLVGFLQTRLAREHSRRRRR
jgi:hypothetical protein